MRFHLPAFVDRRTTALVFACVTLISISIFAAVAQTYGTITDVEIVRVYDGATFFVAIESYPAIVGAEIGIRVRGIDCPEIRASCRRERELAVTARDFVRAVLASAERVDLVAVERGKYFRIVATVLVDGVDLSELLIERGLAVRYEQRDEIDWCE